VRAPRRSIFRTTATALLVAGITAVPAQAASAGTQTGARAHNMTLLAHHDLAGSGNLGEGYAQVKTRDGRRILYAAHESGPRCLSVLDVTDPRAPRLLRQIDVPDGNTRCNSLDVSGRTLVVANQLGDPAQPGGTAGVQIYNLNEPTDPRHIGFFDTSGPFSRGAHFVWFADGRYVHISSGMPDFQPRRPNLDDQIYVSLDLKNPARPREVGRWWWPGTRVGDKEPLPEPNQQDEGCRAHNTDVYPGRPDRLYIGYIDCGMAILDISNRARPRPIVMQDDSPPTPGFTHTLQAIHGGRYVLATQEAVEDACADGDKRAYLYRNVPSSRLTRVATLPRPADSPDPCAEGGRFGAHNVFEHTPDEPTWWSDDVILASYFNGGVRAWDVSNPNRPREVAYYVPEPPAGSPAGAVQINDVYADDRGVIFAGDRFTGGLYVLSSPVVRGR
jgi:hypothetical protein